MHELSIAHGLVELVTEALVDSPDCRVLKVNLRVGVLSGVVAEALTFCFDVATRETRLEGSILEITTLPVILRCQVCDRSVELPDAVLFRCPICNTPSADILQGKELEVESFEIQDESDAQLGTSS